MANAGYEKQANCGLSDSGADLVRERSDKEIYNPDGTIRLKGNGIH